MAAKSEKQVRDRVQKSLVDAGVQDRDAGYLAELYASSDRGREHQKENPDVVILGSSCNPFGILPIG